MASVGPDYVDFVMREFGADVKDNYEDHLLLSRVTILLEVA